MFNVDLTEVCADEVIESAKQKITTEQGQQYL